MALQRGGVQRSLAILGKHVNIFRTLSPRASEVNDNNNNSKNNNNNNDNKNDNNDNNDNKNDNSNKNDDNTNGNNNNTEPSMLTCFRISRSQLTLSLSAFGPVTRQHLGARAS